MLDFYNINVQHFSDINFYWQTLIFIIIGYLIGSINFGHLFSRSMKKDLGTLGSKNYGATNAGRNFGAKGFIFVFLGDFLKVFAAFGIMLAFYLTGVLPLGSIAFGLFFVMIGHSWPIYFKFKGGKGVASFVAVSFLLNWVAALIGLLFFIVLLFISRRVAVASITFASVSALSITLIQGVWVNPDILPSWAFDFETILASWAAMTLIIYKHWSNIVNIYTMQESYVKRIDNLTFTLTERLNYYFKSLSKNLSDYYSNTKDEINDLMRENNSKINILNNIESYNVTNLIDYEFNGVIVPNRIHEKRTIKYQWFEFSPSEEINLILTLKNFKQIKDDDFINLINIKDKNDLESLQKNFTKKRKKIICDTSKGRYFTEKSIANGAIAIRINPYAANDIKESLKLAVKKDIPIVLDFNLQTIPGKFFLEEAKKLKSYFNGISDFVEECLENHPDLEKMMISIEYDPQINIIDVIKLVSIIYDYPIIFSVPKNDYYRITDLVENLKHYRLISFINVY